MVTKIIEFSNLPSGELQLHCCSQRVTRCQKRHFRGTSPHELGLEKENSYEKTQKPCNTAKPVDKEKSREKTLGGNECQFSQQLQKRAKACQTLLYLEFGIQPSASLAPRIRCGQLRSALRATYRKDLSPVVELSIKTSAKLEVKWCRTCADSDLEDEIQRYKRSRFQTVSVDEDHLAKFRAMFRRNVESGWNTRVGPYIPNGHATLSNGRKEGGNWRYERFSRVAGVSRVISSGKPRIITKYSSYNTEVLSPLHDSLQKHNERKGWLLVGDPAPAHLEKLTGLGSFVSVDYSSATDNIKTRYVEVAVDILKQQGEGLTKEQVRCMDVVAGLRFEDDGPVATRGQPMGSLMSFPILCLINKTVVDLALTDLLVAGEISFKEWTSHRCLINGDDLLTREPSAIGGRLQSGIMTHGAEIGLIVNMEKTMISQTLAEINSTLFRFDHGKPVLEKKVNLGSLVMGSGVADPVAFALRSTRKKEGLSFVLLKNRQRISVTRESVPMSRKLRWVLKHTPCVLEAFLEDPIDSPGVDSNPFPVVERSPDYDLPSWEENLIIQTKVTALRDSGYIPDDPCRPRIWGVRRRQWSEASRVKQPSLPKERTLKILQQGWLEYKRKMVLDQEAKGIAETRYSVQSESGSWDPETYESSRNPTRFWLIKNLLSKAPRSLPSRSYDAFEKGRSFLRFAE
nr:MAG: putative RNA-dependent RNA polymerase [Botourmiaviridae sp.]